MPIIYKIHDIALKNTKAQSIYDGVLQDGILYKLDGGVKMQLSEIPYWGRDWHQYEYNLCVISFGELFGYADIESGQIIHQPCWEDAMPFYGGLARVKENGKFGFINIAGEYVIGPQWDETESSAHSGLIAVRRDHKWGFVKKSGELVTALEWDAFADSLDDRIQTGWDDSYQVCYKHLPKAVCKDEKWGFIDDCGNIVLEPQFDTLDFVWFNFQVEWREDKAAATVIKGGKEVVRFGHTSTTSDLTVYPMYLSAKRKSRWYRVQVDVDSQISVLKGKHPKKNKDIHETNDFEIAMREDLK